MTSGFSLSRRHPVLHTSRAHRGVDYAAPTGAPVVAVASGTVVAATYDSANGRMVRIRHPPAIRATTCICPGLLRDTHRHAYRRRVTAVGFVGSTGLSTGPHLHYGLTKNGTFVNPIDRAPQDAAGRADSCGGDGGLPRSARSRIGDARCLDDNSPRRVIRNTAQRSRPVLWTRLP